MATACTRVRLALAAIALLMFALAALPAAAQQFKPTTPNADAVNEQQLLQQLNRIQGLGTIPDTRSYVIEQPLGRSWRLFHEVWLHWIGTAAIVGMVTVAASWTRGVFDLVGDRQICPRFFQCPLCVWVCDPFLFVGTRKSSDRSGSRMAEKGWRHDRARTPAGMEI